MSNTANPAQKRGRAQSAPKKKAAALQRRWTRSVAQARLLQEQLRGLVVTDDRLGAMCRVAGVDAHYAAGQVSAAVVVMSFSDLAIVESALVRRAITFPYVPGLLSFREAPATLEALHRLSENPRISLARRRHKPRTGSIVFGGYAGKSESYGDLLSDNRIAHRSGG